jgi:hypothetical protein
MYRDASNYKQWHSVIVKGVFSLEEAEPFLFDGDGFIPSQVGLKDVHFEFTNEDDHIWHEIADVEPTEEEAMDLTAELLMERIKTAHSRGWDVTKATEELQKGYPKTEEEKPRQKIVIDITERDCQELMHGEREFNWTYPTDRGEEIDIRIFNPDFVKEGA